MHIFAICKTSRMSRIVMLQRGLHILEDERARLDKAKQDGKEEDMDGTDGPGSMWRDPAFVINQPQKSRYGPVYYRCAAPPNITAVLWPPTRRPNSPPAPLDPTAR
jgi:hypothetical protein